MNETAEDALDDAMPERATAGPWLWLSGVVVALDQLTKWLIVSYVELADRVVVNPLLTITHRRNPGAAFSFLADQPGWQRWFFIALAIAVSVTITVWILRLPRRGQAALAIGLALILGGAVGNVVDRVHYGYVIDFMLVGYGNLNFPFAFNIADSAISVGAALLIFDSLFGGAKR